MQVKDHTKSLHLDIPIEQLQIDPNQPRRPDSFNSQTLQELAQSLKSVGLINPLLVKKIAENQYQIIAGERRYRAAKLAGFKTISVCVQSRSDLQSALAALTENLQREDLNPIDQALSLEKLVDQFNLSQTQLSELLGQNRATLANQMRVLSLPDLIQKALKERVISLGHAKALMSLDTKESQISLFQTIIRDQLSVRQTEALAARSKEKKHETTKKSKTGFFLRQIEEKLQEKFGTKVSFKGCEKSGTLSFHYYNLIDLNRLLSELGYNEES